jgi:hypothetical protein
MRNDSIYVKVDEASNLVHTSGVTFRDFIEGTGLSGRGLLILAGFMMKHGCFCGLIKVVQALLKAAPLSM